jgi:hypothetical protein
MDKLPICEGCDMEWPPFCGTSLLKSIMCAHCRRAYEAGIKEGEKKHEEVR